MKPSPQQLLPVYERCLRAYEKAGDPRADIERRLIARLKARIAAAETHAAKRKKL